MYDFGDKHNISSDFIFYEFDKIYKEYYLQK